MYNNINVNFAAKANELFGPIAKNMGWVFQQEPEIETVLIENNFNMLNSETEYELNNLLLNLVDTYPLKAEEAINLLEPYDPNNETMDQYIDRIFLYIENN